MSVTQTSSNNRSIGRSRWLLVVVLMAFGFAVLLLALRRSPLQKPLLIGRAQGHPESIQRHQGAWYWLEQTKDAGRLVRATPSNIQVLASAEALPRYAMDENRLVWAARQGRQWTVSLANADGSGARALWSGAEEPMGLTLAQGRIYWLHRLPAPVSDGSPFPPLSPSLEILSMPLEGGNPTSVGRLWEAEDGVVLGFTAGALMVATYRHAPPGSFCLYRVAQGGAVPVRIAAERGCPPAILAHDGSLYWFAPSAEAASPQEAYCLRRLDKAGHLETLSDWLPKSSRLYDTAHGIVCGDAEFTASLWPSGQAGVFPEPLPLPVGYSGLAAGEEEALLFSTNTMLSNPTLYEMRLP